MSGERQGDATLGVKTVRGDFERALVADVIRALQATGVHELAAGNLLRLVPVEDGLTGAKAPRSKANAL